MGNRERNEEGAVPRWLEGGASATGQAPPPWAMDLVKSADPIRATPTQMRRMLLRLSDERRPRRTAWLRPIVVGAVLLGGATIASAAFTGWPSNLVRACRRLVTRPRSINATPPEAANRGAPVSGPGFHEDAVLLPPLAPQADLATPAPVLHRAGPDTRGRSRIHAEVGPAEDPSLVVDATRALRVAQDPRRARLLAARYLHDHPGGALAEEALAIVVEAAVAHGDPDAAAQAAHYLSLYPHGSFRAAAERALSAR